MMTPHANSERHREVRTKMKPTVLIATTSRWFPTARLAMALASAGCIVEAVSPPGHPIAKTRCVRARNN